MESNYNILSEKEKELAASFVKFMKVQELEINTLKTYMVHINELVKIVPPSKDNIKLYFESNVTNTKRAALKKWIEFYSDLNNTDQYNNLKIPKSRHRPKTILPKHLNYEQLSKIDMKKLTPFEFMLLSILIDSAMRATELLNIEVETHLQFFKDERIIKVPNSKYGSGIKTGGRNVSVTTYTKNLIISYLNNRRSKTKYLIPFRSRQRLYQIIKNIGHKLYGNYFNLHPHMLRHTRGFIAINEHKSLKEIQDYFGHKNITSTSIYTALDETKTGEFLQRSK